MSAPDAIAQAVEHYLEEKEGIQEELPIGQPAPSASGAKPQTSVSTGYVAHGEAALDSCPACGASQLAYEEGCKKCYVCGYSECG